MMVNDLAIVEKQLGFSYEMDGQAAEHYQRRGLLQDRGEGGGCA